MSYRKAGPRRVTAAVKTQSRVRFEQHASAYFAVSLRCEQGAPLPTFLFDVNIDDLLQELHTRPAQHCIEMEAIMANA